MIYGIAAGCFGIGMFAGWLVHWAYVGASAEIDAEQQRH